MRKDIATLTDQITSALNEFAGSANKQARSGYRQARSNADDMMSDWAERGSAAAGAAYDAAMSMEDSVEDAISERPLIAIGLAVAFGFMLGATWRR